MARTGLGEEQAINPTLANRQPLSNDSAVNEAAISPWLSNNDWLPPECGSPRSAGPARGRFMSCGVRAVRANIMLWSSAPLMGRLHAMGGFACKTMQAGRRI